MHERIVPLRKAMNVLLCKNQGSQNLPTTIGGWAVAFAAQAAKIMPGEG
jgi:hypothetical protein